MYKDYQKPDAEYVSFVAEEEITTLKAGDFEYLDGEMNLESSIF